MALCLYAQNFDSLGECVFVAVGSNLGNGQAKRGVHTSRCSVPGDLLNNGLYFVGIVLTFIHKSMRASFYDRQGLSFTVVAPIDETLVVSRCGYAGPIPGAVRPNLHWETRRTS
jgi:lipopolysaccharide transport system ATP-binding protein